MINESITQFFFLAKLVKFLLELDAVTTTIDPSKVEDDPDAKQFTVAKLVELVKVLEEAFPDIPANEMVHKLRMLVSRYDSNVWKVRGKDTMFNF